MAASSLLAFAPVAASAQDPVDVRCSNVELELGPLSPSAGGPSQRSGAGTADCTYGAETELQTVALSVVGTGCPTLTGAFVLSFPDRQIQQTLRIGLAVVQTSVGSGDFLPTTYEGTASLEAEHLGGSASAKVVFHRTKSGAPSLCDEDTESSWSLQNGSLVGTETITQVTGGPFDPADPTKPLCGSTDESRPCLIQDEQEASALLDRVLTPADRALLSDNAPEPRPILVPDQAGIGDTVGPAPANRAAARRYVVLGVNYAPLRARPGSFVFGSVRQLDAFEVNDLSSPGWRGGYSSRGGCGFLLNDNVFTAGVPSTSPCPQSVRRTNAEFIGIANCFGCNTYDTATLLQRDPRNPMPATGCRNLSIPAYQITATRHASCKEPVTVLPTDRLGWRFATPDFQWIAIKNTTYANGDGAFIWMPNDGRLFLKCNSQEGCSTNPRGA